MVVLGTVGVFPRAQQEEIANDKQVSQDGSMGEGASRHGRASMAHKLDRDRFYLVWWGVLFGMAFEQELELTIQMAMQVKTGV